MRTAPPHHQVEVWPIGEAAASPTVGDSKNEEVETASHGVVGNPTVCRALPRPTIGTGEPWRAPFRRLGGPTSGVSRS
jgi:hypothetical protein